jgi:hypothetical protein
LVNKVLTLGIVLGGAEADDVGVVVGVAVVEVLEQVGGLDGPGASTEVGVSRSGYSTYLDGDWSDSERQFVGALGFVGFGVNGVVSGVLFRVEAFDEHVGVGGPGGHTE